MFSVRRGLDVGRGRDNLNTHYEFITRHLKVYCLEYKLIKEARRLAGFFCDMLSLNLDKPVYFFKIHSNSSPQVTQRFLFAPFSSTYECPNLSQYTVLWYQLAIPLNS